MRKFTNQLGGDMSEENANVIDVNNDTTPEAIVSDAPVEGVESIEISSDEMGASDHDKKVEEGIDYGVLDEQEPESEEDDTTDVRPRNKLERLMRKKERELEQERMEKEMLKQRIAEQSQQAVATQSPENFGIIPPRRDDFVDEDEYIDARMQYNINMQGLRYKKQQIEAAQEKKHEETVKVIENTINTGIGKYADFESVTYDLLKGNFPANVAMAEALFDSEYSDDIAYVLGKNMAEARKIALLPPIKAVKKIAEIEAKIKAMNAAKRSSSKPKIIEPMKAGHKPGAVGTKSLSDYSSAELEKVSVREMNELEKSKPSRRYY